MEYIDKYLSYKILYESYIKQAHIYKKKENHRSIMAQLLQKLATDTSGIKTV